MKRNVMLVGRSRAGKTTLAENLVYGKSESKKTQSVEWVSNFIDTPGEFMENPRLYRALLVTSYDADVVVLVEESVEENSVFPPNFASAFAKPVIGVITKADLGGDLEQVRENLMDAGAEKIFIVDYTKPETLETLKEYLDETQGRQ